MDSKERSVYTGSVEGSVVLNSSTASETIRVYSLGDCNESKQDSMLGETKEAEL